MLQSIFSSAGKNKISLKQTLVEFLNEKNFQYESTDDDDILILPMHGENGNWRMLFQINEEKELLEIRSYCPIKIKYNQKLRLAELITRINYNLVLGCFTMDFEDGRIFFSIAHLSREANLNIKTLNTLFNTNAHTLDQFLQ